MKYRSPLAVAAIHGVLLSTFVSANAAGDPLCASLEARRTVQSALAKSPELSPAQIAEKLGLSEAAVVNSLPADTRVPVDMSAFDNVWDALTEWDDALLIALSSDSVFEMAGPIPEGNVARGYFNFDATGTSYGGHLKVDRLAVIYLLSTNEKKGETHQVAFFDQTGRRAFSVYVPRDEEGALQSQPHSRFLRMKQQYRSPIEGSMLTDAGCLGSDVNRDAARAPEPE